MIKACCDKNIDQIYKQICDSIYLQIVREQEHLWKILEQMELVRKHNEEQKKIYRRSVSVQNQQTLQEKQKYDLSKWNYSELRDTINTSCDTELLEACRHEFHRRLKAYHTWKVRNRRRTAINENERTPTSIMDTAASKSPNIQPKTSIIDNRQRYFRIPFVRPASTTYEPDAGAAGGNHGWWYGHFDGQRVARQIELYPDKPAVLLVAGIDDMKMCELSLDETGLTQRHGAKITDHEFNCEWERHGGKSYIRSTNQNQSFIKNLQRYFRIPFVHSDEGGVGPKRHWWYAHFDGEYLAREMELHPHKPPLLLVAGIDDLKMCHFHLYETGLTRRHDMEITEHEFNREWVRHGGNIPR